MNTLEANKKTRAHRSVQTAYELGEDSPTGTHLIISKETLESFELEKDGLAHRVWKDVGLKIFIGACSASVAAVIVAKLLRWIP